MFVMLGLSAPQLIIGPERPSALADAAPEIDAHWQSAQRANPSLFDGAIVMLARWQFANEHFEATCFSANFREYLFWRESGRPDWGFRHLYGVAAIQLHGGALLVVRAAPHTINSGRFHLPGGFVDLADADRGSAPGSQIDIAGQIFREIEEELGVARADVVPTGHWLVIDDGSEIGVVMVLRPAMDDARFQARVLDGVQGTGAAGPRAVDAAENTEVQFVASADDVGTEAWVPYCARVARTLLDEVE